MPISSIYIELVSFEFLTSSIFVNIYQKLLDSELKIGKANMINSEDTDRNSMQPLKKE